MTDELRAETIRVAENAQQYRRVLERMVADARSRPPDPTLAVAVSVDMLALLLGDLAAAERATPEPAPDVEATGLDAAWAEVESALPEGYGIGVSRTVAVRAGPYVATTDFGPVERGYAYGPTPAAALLALRAALHPADPSRTKP